MLCVESGQWHPSSFNDKRTFEILVQCKKKRPRIRNRRTSARFIIPWRHLLHMCTPDFYRELWNWLLLKFPHLLIKDIIFCEKFLIWVPSCPNDASDGVREGLRDLDEPESLVLGVEQPVVELVERFPLQLKVIRGQQILQPTRVIHTFNTW